MFNLRSLIFPRVNLTVVRVRFLYGVHHNEGRNIFYIKFQDNARAVLAYKRDGRILDMYTINVPSQHTGEGVARRLAEAAFTYAIVNNYYMYLTCEYLQKYYLATKTVELEELIIGPSHILEGPTSESLNQETVDELPDPQDFMVTPSNKK